MYLKYRVIPVKLKSDKGRWSRKARRALT